MELMNLDLKGGKYTGRKGDRHDTAARLDKILISDDLDSCFRNIKQRVVHKVTSDHSPIILHVGTGKIPNPISNLRTDGCK